MCAIELLKLISEKLDSYNHASAINHISHTFHIYTLTKLKEILDVATEKGTTDIKYLYDYNRLNNFLTEFHTLVQNTDALPLHDPNSFVSGVMLSTAKILANYFINKNALQLLMPSIQITDYIISGTSLQEEENIGLRGLLLSDDNTHLIEVLPCLDYAAEDGILKHTCMIRRQILYLSAKEQSRVIDYCPEATAYWDAIQNNINLKICDESFGAVLHTLATALFEGGTHGDMDGKEFNAGVNANIGIVNFFTWYDSIAPQEQETLGAFKIDVLRMGDIITLNQIFTLLKNPVLSYNSHPTEQSSKYCVHLISQDIKQILIDNPILFEIYPENATVNLSNDKKIAKTHLDNARYDLQQAILNNDYDLKVTASYGDNAKKLLSKRILKLTQGSNPNKKLRLHL